jgi:hypothetical protein
LDGEATPMGLQFGFSYNYGYSFVFEVFFISDGFGIVFMLVFVYKAMREELVIEM